MHHHRDAAERWLLETELTAVHDPAIDFYALKLARASEIQQALSWAERIQDETLRLSSLEAVATRWHRREASAAEAWLEQSPLDEAARRRVRESPPLRRRQRGNAKPPRAAVDEGPSDNQTLGREP